MDYHKKSVKKETKEKKLANVFFRTTMLIAGYYLIFYLGTIIFIDEAYRVPNDFGYITLHAYEEHSNDNEINFDTKITVSQSFFSHEVEDKTYDIIFTDQKIFDVGMMNISLFLTPSDFYNIEFIEGTSFSSSDEVVISEKISLDLFQSLDTINKNIVINETTYKIVGVIKNYDDIDDSIFMSSENINHLEVYPKLLSQSLIIVDDELHLKLYEKGGYDLLKNTITRNNQGRAKDFFSIFSVISLFIGFFINERMQKNDDIIKQTKEESIRKHQELGFSLSLVKSFVWMTLFIIYMMIIYIFVLSYEFTFLVSGFIVIDFLIEFPYIFLIYLIPIIDLIITEIKIKRMKRI